MRYERLARRRERPLTREEAVARDWAEIERLEKGGPIAIADYTFNNDGAVADLIRMLDAMLAQIEFTP